MRIALALAAVLFAAAPSAQSIQDQPLLADNALTVEAVSETLVSEAAPAPAVTVDLSQWVDSPALPPSFDNEIQDAPEQNDEVSGVVYWSAMAGTAVGLAVFTSFFL